MGRSATSSSIGEDDPVGRTDRYAQRRNGTAGYSRGFRHDIAGGLVLAQADEAGVAGKPIRGEFGEGHFGDEARLDKMDAAPGFGRQCVGKGRPVGFKCRQSVADIVKRAIIETGADASGVAQLPRLVDPEQKRGKAAAARRL